MLFGFEEPRTRSPRKKYTPGQKMEVWTKYIGNKPKGQCFVECGTTITFGKFELGHDKSRNDGGTDNIANLRPICGDCNRDMGTMSITTYKRKLHGPAKTSKKKTVATAKKQPTTKAKAKPKTSRRRPKDPFEAFFSGF